MSVLDLSDEDRERYEAVRRDTRARDEKGEPVLAEPYCARRPSLGRQPYGSKVRIPASPAAERFAELIFDRFDAWEVVTSAAAAKAAGISEGLAATYKAELKAAGNWPYRSAKWRMDMQKEGRVGPFRRALA